MMGWIKGRRDRDKAAQGFLQRLRADIRGNTLAIMAAGLIPLIGLLGSALDMSRLYIAKTRLQQACDAGALAGRKVMGPGQWTANSNAALAAANKFFEGNFTSGSYGTNSLTKTFTESNGKVSGTASVTVPMVLMQIFRAPTQVLTVTCDAEMRLPNTDVMFVLDMTGSMDGILTGDTQTKLSALRKAVKCFYETVAKEDTNADCGGTPPSGGIGNSVQIRFGFMPYATNVNVGKLLDQSWIADRWGYNTRVARWAIGAPTTVWGNTVDSVGTAGSGNSPSGTPEDVSNRFLSCPALLPNQSNVAGTYQYDTAVVTSGNTRTNETRTYTRVNITYDTYWGGAFGAFCYLRKTTSGTGSYTSVLHTQTSTTTTTRTFQDWTYKMTTATSGSGSTVDERFDVSGLKGANGVWNNRVSLEIGSNGTATDVNWEGCIEERKTVSQTSYDPIPATAKDLNIDLVPSSADPESLWGPALNGVIVPRQVLNGARTQNAVTGVSNTQAMGRTDDDPYRRSFSYNCPNQAKRLGVMSGSQVDSYVDGLNADGSTYHDIGILWGARFMSPSGIFAADNAFTPRGGEIERHMIFMTDGETCTTQMNYTAYGVPWYDRRTTSDVSSECNSGAGTDDSALGAQVNARFTAICQAVRNKNITLWVIYFGTTNIDTTNRMTACATPGRFYQASNATVLISTFQTIASQISQLRLTR